MTQAMAAWPRAMRHAPAALDHLPAHHQAWLGQARRFCLVAAGAPEPRAHAYAGPAGFVQALDARTLAFANANASGSGRPRGVARPMLRHDECLRLWFTAPDGLLCIAGRGRTSTDPPLLLDLGGGRQQPGSATVVLIDQVLHGGAPPWPALAFPPSFAAAARPCPGA